MSGSDKWQSHQPDFEASATGSYDRDGVSQPNAVTGENSTGRAENNASKGSITIGASTLVLRSGELEANVVKVKDPGQFDFTGGTLKVGYFSGTLVQNGGTFEPGGSDLAVTEVHGNYHLSSEGTLRMQVGETGHDQLIVSGNVEIEGGSLDVAIDFVPDGGNSLTIIETTGDAPLKGEFGGREDGKTFYTTVGDKLVPLQLTYEPGGITLTLKTLPEPEDIAEFFPADNDRRPEDGGKSNDPNGPIPLDKTIAHLEDGEHSSSEEPPTTNGTENDGTSLTTASLPTNGISAHAMLFNSRGKALDVKESEDRAALSDSTGDTGEDGVEEGEVGLDGLLAFTQGASPPPVGDKLLGNGINAPASLGSPQGKALGILGSKTTLEQPSGAEPAPDPQSEADIANDNGPTAESTDPPADAPLIAAPTKDGGNGDEFALDTLLVWAKADDTFSFGNQTLGNGPSKPALISLGNDASETPDPETEPEQSSGSDTSDPVIELGLPALLVGMPDDPWGGDNIV